MSLDEMRDANICIYSQVSSRFQQFPTALKFCKTKAAKAQTSA